MVRFLLLLGLAVFSLLPKAFGQEAVTHYPINLPKKQNWSFAGPFGTYDKAQLQRGLQVYTEICAACHSLKYVAYRDLTALGYNMQEIKDYAAQYEVQDGPNLDGEMFMRQAMPSDYFKNPFENEQMAKLANNGAVPVDLSLVAKARAVSQPFPALIRDVFTNYNEAGADYITALLTGYQNAPAGIEIPFGNYYNPYYISGDMLSMAPPLQDHMIRYKDGTLETVENYARDVSAFLSWSADPHMEVRKKTGFRVILFLIVLALLVYAVKRRIWNEVDREKHERTA